MSDIFEQLKPKVSAANKKIVFPESLDERILEAASKLAGEGILTPVLIGEEAAIKDKAASLSFDISGCKP